MGWIGPGEHEGWVVPVFADGIEGIGTTGSLGVLVDFDRDEWRPDEDVTGWRAGCECGWRGPFWTRVHDSERKPWFDATTRQINNPGKFSAYLEDAAERVVVDEWRQHIAPHKIVEVVEDAAMRYSAAGRDLDDAVREAHSAGASWADIGRAVGITRQSARERWGA